MEQLSEIQKFYLNKTIFLTGATGFVGKLTLEKLLRGCPGIRHVYILVRVKKEKTQTKRLEQLLESPIFDALKRARFNFDEKVSTINGDLLQPELSLSEDDKRIIIEEVDIIIHCAATVRFDQKLSQATKINIIATRDLLNIAKKSNKLKSYVHVSTAYSNCDRKEIDEIVYEPKIEGSKLTKVIESLNDELLFEMQPKLLGKLPNTYTLTKQVAEDVVKQEGQTLPVCIVRPSIIIGAADEPLKGFVDNYYGPTGIFLGCGLGFLKCVLMNEKNVADLVPVDFVVNHILAAAWHIGTERVNREPKDPEVLNLVSGVDNAITWGQFSKYMHEIGLNYATKKMIWYPFVVRQTNRYVHSVLHYLLHIIPAHIVDTIARVVGKEPMLVAAYAKVTNAAEIICYFPMHEWNYRNSNTKKLIQKMSPRDKELFNFDMKSLDWLEYSEFYIKAVRFYILGDTPDTIEEGKVHYRKLKYIHYTVCSVLILLFYYCLKMLFGFLF